MPSSMSQPQKWNIKMTAADIPRQGFIKRCSDQTTVNYTVVTA